MRKMISNWLTGPDNVTHDPARALWVLGSLAYLGMQVYAIAKGQAWNPEAFAFGFSALLVGGGAGVAVKSGSEPPAKAPAPPAPAYGEGLDEARK